MHEKIRIFITLLEDPDVHSSWNGKPVRKLGGHRIQIGDKEFDFNDNIQQPESNVSPNLEKLSCYDLLTFKYILKTVDWKSYEPRAGAAKSIQFEYTKDYFPRDLQTLKLEF